LHGNANIQNKNESARKISKFLTISGDTRQPVTIRRPKKTTLQKQPIKSQPKTNQIPIKSYPCPIAVGHG
jgi:hypothetical protein